MTSTAKYQDRLRSIPAPGTGCHAALLSAANLGVMAGLDLEKIFADIRQSIPTGKRRISDREIHDAIQKAKADHDGGTYTPRPRPKPIINNGLTTRSMIIEHSTISDDVDLWESSPIRLWDEPNQDAALLLGTLYRPDDLIWIGERYAEGTPGQTIRPADEWISYFRHGRQTSPHIIINPLNNIPTTTKGGDKLTLRGDGNIASYRYSVIEFDDLSREAQIRFWSAVKLPIVALIDTGGKSIHAWIDVSKLATVETAEQWDIQIKRRLYDQILTPMGVDAACSNPSRLSRLPGHYRTEKSAWQRLLWLSQEG